MNPRIVKVYPENGYMLRLHFTNGEIRRFDVKPYLETGIFRELKDVSVFNTAKPDGLSVEWSNEASICPDTLYENSEPVK
jgi:antitoxin component YwqK of YwqJK toxin-antitoxin module